MKRSFFLLCAVLFVLGSLLPLAGYRLAKTVLGPSAPASSAAAPEPETPDSASLPPSDRDSETFLIADQSDGAVVSVPRRDYLIGAVAAEMPITWPDEALKAQAIAAHSYVLYCRDHAQDHAAGWLTADPARRQGYLTDAVLRSYWGTAYEANYARLSALVDSVLTQVLYYEDAPAGTSYFAISNGQTEASENVWGTAVPYLIPVDSSTDQNADNYIYTVSFSAAQLQQLLTGLGLTPDLSAPEGWFGDASLTPSGYVASLPVCGQTVTGPALRKTLGLRSACFTVQYQNGSFFFTTRGYGHGVGMSQWGARALAEQGQTASQILAHYFPGTQLRQGAAPTKNRRVHLICTRRFFGSFYWNRLSSQLNTLLWVVVSVVGVCSTTVVSVAVSAAVSSATTAASSSSRPTPSSLASEVMYQ